MSLELGIRSNEMQSDSISGFGVLFKLFLMMRVGEGIDLDSCNNVVTLSRCESTCLSTRIFYSVVHSRRSDIGRLSSAARTGDATEIGECGNNLSGGLKSRVALTRAIIYARSRDRKSVV